MMCVIRTSQYFLTSAFVECRKGPSEANSCPGRHVGDWVGGVLGSTLTKVVLLSHLFYTLNFQVRLWLNIVPASKKQTKTTSKAINGKSGQLTSCFICPPQCLKCLLGAKQYAFQNTQYILQKIWASRKNTASLETLESLAALGLYSYLAIMSLSSTAATFLRARDPVHWPLPAFCRHLCGDQMPSHQRPLPSRFLWFSAYLPLHRSRRPNPEWVVLEMAVSMHEEWGLCRTVLLKL